MKTLFKNKWFIRLTKAVLLFFVVLTTPNYYTVIYDFETPTPFYGNAFYNPYKTIGDTWLTCNFHAHSELFGGLTNGENSILEMHEKYQALGYDIPCISNYNSVTPQFANKKYPLLAYEHGLNRGWIHQLVLNDKKAKPFDYPVFQLTSHKQFMLNRLKNDTNLIVLAHPSFQKGYAAEEMSYLTNYDLIEGVSVRANSINLWDKLLSAGRAKWIVANDDSHDTLTAHTGVTWTSVNVLDNSKNGVLESLKAGRHIAQRGWMAQFTANIESLTVTDQVYRLKITHPIDSIILISDGGKQVAYTTNTDSISYSITDENTYVRAELFNSTKWNNYSKLYLNPVIRTTNAEFFERKLRHETNWLLTLLFWFTLAAFHSLVGVVILKWK